MNKILLALLYLSLCLCLNLSNYNSFGQVELNTILLKEVCVSGVPIGTNKNVLLNNFGKSDSTISHINEFEGTEFYEFIYGKSSLFIVENTFTSFDLSENNFYFGINNIRVGDRIETLKSIYPISFKNRNLDKDQSTIRVRIGETDSYVLFISCNNVIIRIMQWDDL